MSKTLNSVLKWALYPFFRRYVQMPGPVKSEPLAALSKDELELKELLFKHVQALSVEIKDRSLGSSGLSVAADYIEKSFRNLGYQPCRQDFMVGKEKLCNLEAVLPGSVSPEKVIVLGAHYDTHPGTPGADDNASGVAALLALAELFAGKPLPLTLRFVAFSNEETYNYETMGSYHYAKRCRENNDEIVGMFSLEMLGCFSHEEGSQNYPFPFKLFYPDKGNFIAFVGNTASADFLKSAIGTFRELCRLPAHGCAAPDWVSDASRSDHLSFWNFGYPALMLTDTSNFRYKHYHGDGDSIDKLDFEAMSILVAGLAKTLGVLARS